MRHLNLMLVVFAITLGTSAFANPINEDKVKREPVSVEIQKMLEDSNLIVEEEFLVTVIFKVTQDRRIEIQTVRSENEEVNDFLKSRLQHQKLHGENWFTQKIYELPVKVQAMK